MHYAALGTTTHFVERSVKVYNFCSNKSRTKGRVSQSAICFNITHNINHLTKELMIKAKRERGGVYKDKGKIKAVGKIKNKTVLENVLDRHNTITNAIKMHPQLQETYDDIADVIFFNNTLSFQDQHVTR